MVFPISVVLADKEVLDVFYLAHMVQHLVVIPLLVLHRIAALGVVDEDLPGRSLSRRLFKEQLKQIDHPSIKEVRDMVCL